MLNYSKPQKDLEEVIGRYLSVILVILLFHEFVGGYYTIVYQYLSIIWKSATDSSPPPPSATAVASPQKLSVSS